MYWEPISTAPKDGTTFLAWDGEVFAVPVVAFWRPALIGKCPIAGPRKNKALWPTIACSLKDSWWCCVEEPLQEIADCGGGFLPTHWARWEPPTPPTLAAWDRE